MAVKTKDTIQMTVEFNNISAEDLENAITKIYSAIPVGSYQQFIKTINEADQGTDHPFTIGILMLNYSQPNTKGFFLSYIDIFDKKSEKIFDFYLPGYTTDAEYVDENGKKKPNETAFELKGKQYYYCQPFFNEFLLKLESEFQIKPTYGPMLILMEMTIGHIGEAKIACIELDNLTDNSSDRSAMFFDDLLSIMKKTTKLNEILNYKKKEVILSEVADKILVLVDTYLGNNLVSETFGLNKKISVYRIKK